MTRTYRLHTIQHAVEVGVTLSASWFRGHSRIIGDLIPTVFRSKYRDEVTLMARPSLELETIEEFKRHAAHLHGQPLPSVNDHLDWLCLMQHHGAPTRLLDWTEHVLVALYFAVVSDEGEDGELWAMLPWALNEVSAGGWGIPLPGRNVKLQYLVLQPNWTGTAGSLAEELGLDGPVTSPVAIGPTRSFPRMIAQAGVFTIHPTPDDTTVGITTALGDHRHLVRCIIPATAKRGLRKDLHGLGVHDMALFPDLEGLAGYVSRENEVIAYGPPSPPTCGGTWE